MAVCLLTSSQPHEAGYACTQELTCTHPQTHALRLGEGLRVCSCRTKAGEESENWPVMEGALFIYPHKRAHLYICPDNFIVLSASTKMVKNVSSSSTRFNQKCVCLLIKKASLERRRRFIPWTPHVIR